MTATRPSCCPRRRLLKRVRSEYSLVDLGVGRPVRAGDATASPRGSTVPLRPPDVERRLRSLAASPTQRTCNSPSASARRRRRRGARPDRARLRLLPRGPRSLRAKARSGSKALSNSLLTGAPRPTHRRRGSPRSAPWPRRCPPRCPRTTTRRWTCRPLAGRWRARPRYDSKRAARQRRFRPALSSGETLVPAIRRLAFYPRFHPRRFLVRNRDSMAMPDMNHLLPRSRAAVLLSGRYRPTFRPTVPPWRRALPRSRGVTRMPTILLLLVLPWRPVRHSGRNRPTFRPTVPFWRRALPWSRGAAMLHRLLVLPWRPVHHSGRNRPTFRPLVPFRRHPLSWNHGPSRDRGRSRARGESYDLSCRLRTIFTANQPRSSCSCTQPSRKRWGSLSCRAWASTCRRPRATPGKDSPACILAAETAGSSSSSGR